MYQSWKKWAEDAGEHPGTNKAFSDSLEECGYKRKHTRNGTTFYGIALTPTSEISEEEAAARWPGYK